MTFGIAAAGTGGHVYPGLAVGEALVAAGVARSDVLFIGGSRLEATAAPGAGFPFLEVELRGLQRRLTLANVGIPGVVLRAVRAIGRELAARNVAALLGMGGYVSVPAALAARRRRLPYALAEQNAGAGLANRTMAGGARRVFGSFPHTHGLHRAEWVGNPIRQSLAAFDRSALRSPALDRWGFDPSRPVLGVFGGSLGAGILNRSLIDLTGRWPGEPLQILHLAGQGAADLSEVARVSPHRWVVLDFCHDMESFYAACDLVVARAGGSVAELTATATPSVLVPGGFGSGGHQAANAAALESVGAAVTVPEDELGRLPHAVAELLADPSRRATMAAACAHLAKPDAASTIAGALVEMARS
ncbi:MAG TPA: UDP-N-acetylglucosamine--N-acetylmuramyl-(pentapeptide) pyrophosphoryl-undecaprenol N-acetylglucosamine transferase [Acidimicrobiia bacterium]|nr:UDP-N-acetylglucosamine--N-acetylmuramyl-(pentapeptide) pyrophosphoryl-undecaprenol N-acetylglucosamine transferase [Acidimicrobiia bacterium]